MSLLSSIPMSNVTTYRKDFRKKTAFRPAQVTVLPDYKNPITGPMEEHVLPSFKYKNLPQPQTKYPDPKEFAQHVAETYPSTRIYLRDAPGGPPDLDVIDSSYQDDNRTTYMVSYCERGDYESKVTLRTRKCSFPEGWVIHLTTQKCSYRPPQLLIPEGFSKPIRFHPKENLIPNKKEREVLNVKTGETIYNSDISETGMEIIKGKLHGDVNVRPKFDEDDLLKAKLIRTN